jgi:DNA-directed RNA polymerase specialized sigma24 family protein
MAQAMSAVSDDLERRLRTWALWYHCERRYLRRQAVVSSIYIGAERMARTEGSIPLSDGEAQDTHQAVERLLGEWRNALRACYLRIDPRGAWLGALLTGQVARRLGCSESTYRRRLADAKAALRIELRERQASLRRCAGVAETR